MMVIPSKDQWSKWTLPSKASYLGAWLGGIGLLASLIFFLANTDSERPIISILKVDSVIHADSMETKFFIKNTGHKAAFLVIEGGASINGTPISTVSKKLENRLQTIMPSQILRYRALTIKGKTFKMMLHGTSTPEVIQTINVDYGSSPETVGEYYTFQKVKLDPNKLTGLMGQSKTLDGLWLLEESNAK